MMYMYLNIDILHDGKSENKVKYIKTSTARKSAIKYPTEHYNLLI